MVTKSFPGELTGDLEARIQRIERALSLLDPQFSRGSVSFDNEIIGRLGTGASVARPEVVAYLLTETGLQPISAETASVSDAERALLDRVGSLEKRNSALESKLTAFEFLFAEFSLSRDVQDRVQVELRKLRKQFSQTLLEIGSIGALSQERVHRAVPVSIYLSTFDREKAERIFSAVERLADLVGFEVLDADAPVMGSWFKRFVISSRDAITSDEVQGRLSKLEEALELKHIEKVKSGIDVDLSSAAMNLAQALASHDEGVIVIGSLVAVKTRADASGGGGGLFVRKLNSAQMELLNTFPSIQKSPKDMSNFLIQSCEGASEGGDTSQSLNGPGSRPLALPNRQSEGPID